MRIALKAIAYRLGSLILAGLILHDWSLALAVVLAGTAWYVVIEIAARERL